MATPTSLEIIVDESNAFFDGFSIIIRAKLDDVQNLYKDQPTLGKSTMRQPIL